MPEVLTPRCPSCGADPSLMVGTQAFCGTEGCPVFTWQTDKTAAELAADTAEVNLDTGVKRDHTHHWVPVREGRLANGEPSYVQRCQDCRMFYRDGQVSDT